MRSGPLLHSLLALGALFAAAIPLSAAQTPRAGGSQPATRATARPPSSASRIPGARAEGDSSLSLAGTWSFRLDPRNQGIPERWYAAALPDRIHLPGSTDEAGFGTPNNRPATFDTLSRKVEYTGPAWYQREVVVPKTWAGRRVTLFLERCHWETRAWVDGRPFGFRDSLCVPHVYDFGTLAPGRHSVTLRVDNTLKYDMGGAAHSTSEQTQTNWNGVVGRLELRSSPAVWIEDVQVYPDAPLRSARVRVRVGNITRRAAVGSLQLTWGDQGAGRPSASMRVPCPVPDGGGIVSADLPMAGGDRPWDEFSPTLGKLSLQLTAQTSERSFSDRAVRTYGLRTLASTPAKRLTLNGRPLFLRGTLECCIFPKTGYPPTRVDDWLRILRVCKSYGLNHLRFHSWCPPEAAFQAADRLGFLLQVEAPCWVANWGKDAARDRWVAEEVQRILDCYGNHPSFALMSMGNEPGGDYKVIHGYVAMVKRHDPRHLYTAGSGWGAGPRDDYHVTPEGRGVFGPATDQDNRATVARHAAPIVEHEVGQWAVYPRMAEIPKYDGVLRARNFERIREDLRAKGLLDQAEEFTQASGKLSALLYKEEIERLLRTPGQAGFALLDLHDFPGQGTALVGVLDPFWDSKGLTTPEQWRRFCAPTVPLLRLPKRTYTTAETLSASADIAHYGPQDLTDARPEWSVRDQRGRVIANGSWPALQLRTGELTHLGALQVPFQGLDAPAKLTVTISLAGTTVANDWEVWVYPATSEEEPRSVTISQSWDEATRKALASGGRVLLQVTRPAGNVRGRFTPLFWSPVWFRDQPLTMGMLCQPTHPAFGLFPTEAQTNWQWYDLLNDARCLVLDDLPRGLRPISQAVDAFTRNHKLAYLFEARVGSGRLLVTSLDLSRDLDQRPAARQLRRSLLAYMASDAFRPQQALSETELEPVLSSGPASQVSRLGAKVVSVDSEAPGFEASRLLDDNADTLWHTAWEGPRPPFPHQVTVDLGAPRVLKAVLCLPRQDQTNGWVRGYAIYLSTDGVTWGSPVVHGSFARDADLKRISLPAPTSARYLRFEALSGFDSQPFASLAELDVEVK